MHAFGTIEYAGHLGSRLGGDAAETSDEAVALLLQGKLTEG